MNFDRVVDNNDSVLFNMLLTGKDVDELVVKFDEFSILNVKIYNENEEINVFQSEENIIIRFNNIETTTYYVKKW